jgi:hypothetical protein
MVATKSITTTKIKEPRMASIQDIPRTLIMNGQSFADSEVKYLQSVFPDLDMAILPKAQIRQDRTLQKAILAGAVLYNTVEYGSNATLNLSQDGRALLGKI